jgi:hypothetical protein
VPERRTSMAETGRMSLCPAWSSNLYQSMVSWLQDCISFAIPKSFH